VNVADMMGALGRRWYVLVAGLIIAGLAAYGAWTLVKVEYTRTATQLMLPGPGTIPDNANPFLFVGGLSQAADVLVRKMGSPDVLSQVEDAYPDVEIVITRDPLSSGPVILASVTSPSDADAEAVIDDLLELTGSTLLDIQRTQGIPSTDRISLVTLTTDDEGLVEQKTRLVASGIAGAGTVALTLLMVALIDGLARSRSQRRGRSRSAVEHAKHEEGADDDLLVTDEVADEHAEEHTGEHAEDRAEDEVEEHTRSGSDPEYEHEPGAVGESPNDTETPHDSEPPIEDGTSTKKKTRLRRKTAVVAGR